MAVISIFFEGGMMRASILKSADTGQLATAAELVLEAAIERAAGCGCSGCTLALPALRSARHTIARIGGADPEATVTRPTVTAIERA